VRNLEVPAFSLPNVTGSMFGRTALVVGKGPTSHKIDVFPGSPVVTLNHACKLFSLPIIAHFVDIEALEDCFDWIIEHRQEVVIPFEPNRGMTRCVKSLDRLLETHLKVRVLFERKQISTYNRAGSHFAHLTAPEIPIRYGSAEGAIGLLAECGVTHFILAGIDGGTEYAPEFSHLKPMQNGRTFDDQWGELLKLRDRKGLTFSRIVP